MKKYTSIEDSNEFSKFRQKALRGFMDSVPVRKLNFGRQDVFLFIFLSQVICITIFCFYLSNILPEKTHEIKHWFVHSFQKYLDHIQRHIQNPGKYPRCLYI